MHEINTDNGDGGVDRLPGEKVQVYLMGADMRSPGVEDDDSDAGNYVRLIGQSWDDFEWSN